MRSTTNSIKFPDYISWSLLCNEIFVFNELSGEITVLRGFSKDLWLFLEQNQDRLEAINYVMDKYSISFEKVNGKIKYLLNQKILIMSEE